jgi:hypothetical protein
LKPVIADDLPILGIKSPIFFEDDAKNRCTDLPVAINTIAADMLEMEAIGINYKL